MMRRVLVLLAAMAGDARVTGTQHSEMVGVKFVDKWAVVVKGGKDVADAVAEAHGFRNIGQIGSLTDHYHFQHQCAAEGAGCIPAHTHSNHHTSRLLQHPKVHWAEQQQARSRTRRAIIPPYEGGDNDANATLSRQRRLAVSDPMWSQQWYLHGAHSNDINVQPVWDRGYTGRGVVVTVVDDGIEHTHPDLHDNYDPSASTDINGNDDDPFPNEADPINKHGTRCCGEIAALKNDVCGIGIAFGCKIGAVRMLDGDVTDSVEAHSLSLAPQHIDIYSNSWGPNDDGRTIEGPASLAAQAIKNGIETGRGGKGSIYVFASGNGGSSGDSCNCDGYCNSIYTIAIGAITEDNTKPYYTEPCTATLASTYSSGTGHQRSIATVDLHGGCTNQHSGTSAAAPLAAGIFALVLEANPRLTWRDLQHLVVRTSRHIDSSDSGWRANGIGRLFNPKYGYGALDAMALVTMAENWTSVPPVIVTQVDGHSDNIHANGGQHGPVTATLSVTEDATCIQKLEHVQVTVDLQTSRRGNIAVFVTCPAGTRSELMPYRRKDASNQPLQWTYMTVECWDESPIGTFTLEITTQSDATVTLSSWSVTLHGTAGAYGTAFASSAPTTAAPTSPQPTSEPTFWPTVDPTTSAPITAAPDTHAPTTFAPTTAAPTTLSPTTLAPGSASNGDGGASSFAPTTEAPITMAPTTQAPTTDAPTTVAPSTAGPTRAATVSCELAPCVAGTYQVLEGGGPCYGDPELCRACPPGYACSGVSGIARPCDLGYSASGSSTECSKCTEGYYADTVASETCTEIAPGFYGVAGKPDTRHGVQRCPAGSMCAGGAADPVPCPKNTSQSATGQTSCTPCLTGYHQPSEGQRTCISTSTSTGGATGKSANGDPPLVMIGVIVGTIVGVTIVALVFTIASTCRTSRGAYTATPPDRFSIDDHDSEDDEVDENYEPTYVPQDNAVFDGMKDALVADDDGANY
eukprot:m.172197 g.172197  ORF g.172197 m.172197 type:complete len:971 (+) comp13486_c0_seq1:235-3147(+)